MHSNVSVFLWRIKKVSVRGGWVIICVCEWERTTNGTLTILGLSCFFWGGGEGSHDGKFGVLISDATGGKRT